MGGCPSSQDFLLSVGQAIISHWSVGSSYDGVYIHKTQQRPTKKTKEANLKSKILNTLFI